jgi:hypothetical protein
MPDSVGRGQFHFESGDEMTLTHTPLPWKIDPHSDETIAICSVKDDLHIAILQPRDDESEESRREADAELICRAVNSHKGLLAACDELLDNFGTHGRCGDPECAECKIYKRAKSAIAKAKGATP